ncbi:MAG: DUF58 domain-containing protein [bacterium]
MVDNFSLKFIENLPNFYLKLTKKYSNRLIFGNNRSIFKGSGIEFIDVREYTEGDDPRYIDWNVSARYNQLFVRNFQEEREIPIFICIDLSSTLFFGTKNKLKIELLIELTAFIINLSHSLNEKLGAFIAFKNEFSYFKPYKKLGNTYKILHFLNNIYKDFFENKEKYLGASNNIIPLITKVNQFLKRTSILFFISDFIDINEDDINKIFWLFNSFVKKNNELILIKVGDPVEFDLPILGSVTLLDPVTKKTRTFDFSNEKIKEIFKQKILSKYKIIQDISIKTNSLYISYLTSENLESKIKEFIKKNRLKNKK